MHCKRSVATTLALVLLTSSSLFPTQDPQRSTGFVLDVGEHDLGELIDRAATFLGRNILADSHAMQAMMPTVEIQKRLEVDALGCEDLLGQLLYTKGFALVPLDTSVGLYEVIQMQGPRRTELMARAITMSPEEILRRPNLKMPVLTSLPLQHSDANVAVNSLRPFFASPGQVGAPLTIGTLGNNRAILLQGFADQVGAAIRVLREADMPPRETDPTLEERVRILEQRLESLEKKVGN